MSATGVQRKIMDDVRATSDVRMINCTSSQGLLLELKAKEATANAAKAERENTMRMLEEQGKQILERIEALNGRDSVSWLERSHLQSQLASIEQRLRMMAVNRHPQEDQAFGSEADTVARFGYAVSELLRRCDGRRCPLSQLPDDPKVRQRWVELQRSRIIRKSTEMKEVLLQRCSGFECYMDSEGRVVVKFAGEKEMQGSPPISLMLGAGPTGYFPPGALALPAMGATGYFPGGCSAPQGTLQNGMLQLGNAPSVGMSTSSAPSMMLALTACPGALGPGGAPHLPVAMTPRLSKEQVAKVEAELSKAGGCERSRKICLHLHLQEEQLAGHFRLYEDRGKTFVTHAVQELCQLEEKLLNLSPRRNDILQAMLFCLEHAAEHAVPLGRVLVRSLEVPELESEAIIARVFLISDVLFNTRSLAKGAARYRATFEEMLPDVCEFLGRTWMRSSERRRLERARAEIVMRSVFDAWRTWDVFSAVFVNGLEALLWGPSPDDSPDAIDAVLERKIAGWCSEASASEIPIAAKRRGLAGPSLPFSACRQRLIIFERYWHAQALDVDQEMLDAAMGATDAAAADIDDIDGESLSDGDLDFVECD